MIWYNKYKRLYDRPLSTIPEHIINQIKHNLKKIQSDTPLATVCLIACNEEERLLACLCSLSEMQCKYPIEIIGINNNSKDRTEEIFQRLEIPYFNESKQGPGFARQCGLDKARGKYFVNIDTDTMYPPKYIEISINKLQKKNVVGVSSSWSYIPDENHSRLGLKLYEFSRDCYMWALHFKRPELAVRGSVFSHDTELAKRYGFRTDITRGEDGSLGLQLKRHGKILFINNRKARAITNCRTVELDGSFFNSFWVRGKKAILSIKKLFTETNYYEDEESNLIK
ncbi:MAG: glycosyltransferase family A protein [Bacteroidaceae bacterium]